MLANGSIVKELVVVLIRSTKTWFLAGLKRKKNDLVSYEFEEVGCIEQSFMIQNLCSF